MYFPRPLRPPRPPLPVREVPAVLPPVAVVAPVAADAVLVPAAADDAALSLPEPEAPEPVALESEGAALEPLGLALTAEPEVLPAPTSPTEKYLQSS